MLNLHNLPKYVVLPFALHNYWEFFVELGTRVGI